MPPTLGRIRSALQMANEAGADPAQLYRRAVDVYRVLSRGRREAHLEWHWPAPSSRRSSA